LPARAASPAASPPQALTRRSAHSFHARKKKVPGKAGARYYKNVGLGFKTPREAITGARRCRAAAPPAHVSASRAPPGVAARREGFRVGHGSRACHRRSAARARCRRRRAARLTLHACGAGTYVDHKCPFTSDVSIRGRILTGTVRSAKMKRTIIIRRDYMHYIKKYQRCVRCPRAAAAASEGGLLLPRVPAAFAPAC